MSTQTFGGAAPIFRVHDIEASLRFYVDILGFIEVSWGNPDFTRAWAWVGISDIAALHRQLVARNVAVRMPPTNFSFPLEMHLEDPDGNILRLGSDPLTEQPFHDFVFPQ